MNLTECFNVALRALVANKLRSGLTMLGMIIGVASVITMMSVGTGASAQVTSSIESMGSNLLFISPGATSSSGVRSSQGSSATLTLEDAEAIADSDNVSGVTAVAPEVSSMGQVVYGSNNVNTRIIGVTPAYEDVRDYHVSTGEFISEENVNARSLVVVLGSSVAEELFGTDVDPVGQSVKINRIQFKVIGVLESKGSQSTGSQDDQIIAPLTTVRARLSMQRSNSAGNTVSQISIQVTDKEQMTAVQQQITSLLLQRHKVSEADFTIQSQADLISTMTSVTGTMTLLLGAIGGISLLVGGIGIMNIMMVSVTERTREIGIRKAVGAKRKDILLQFLIESVVVGIGGGGLGVLLGLALSTVVSNLSISGSNINAVVSSESVIMSVGVSAAIGIFFGLYPAAKASNLNPIDALRYE